MKIETFTVFDEKAGAFLQPFYSPTINTAIRAITDCVNDLTHTFGKHSADYTLFKLGSFDDATGEFTPDKRPLGCLVEFKTQLELPIDPAQLSLVEGGSDK